LRYADLLEGAVPITFRVDDVNRATDLPPTHSLAEHLGDVLAFGGDGAKRVLKSAADCPAALLAAVHVAFAQHRPLVLSPDAVWLTILSGVAQHVKLNAEALRPRLVRHQGKRELKVVVTESLELNPRAVRKAVAGFRSALAREIGQGRAALLTCDFSTSGDVERAASEILLMDTYSPYFDFVVACICGIPELTLLGEARDWRAIRERIDILSELDLGWWTSSLAPILEKFVAASEGSPDAAFFRDIYKPEDAYGGEIIAGWSARFYPYLGSGGRFERRNPLLELPLDYRPPKQERKGRGYDGVGIRSNAVPGGLGVCVLRVEDSIIGRNYGLEVRGGLVGVEVDAQGRLAPCAGWTVSYAKASAGALIGALRERPDFAAEPPEPRIDWMPFSTSERLELADAFGEARLFVGGGEWRLRAPSQAQVIEVEVPLRGYPGAACRVIDLPDGSCICYVDIAGPQPWLIRLLDSELEPLPEPPPIDPVTGLPTKDRVQVRGEPTHRSRQTPHNIEVVGVSLVELLSSALASGGKLPTAVTTLAAKEVLTQAEELCDEYADPASWQRLRRKE
jgi:hypothetical protein